MKARYESNFEYGKKMAKYCIAFSLVACLGALLLFPEGSVQQLGGVLVSIGCFVATIVFVYKYCRCPYCGKHIIMGVLAVKSCPRCHRNLTTGKKTKK